MITEFFLPRLAFWKKIPLYLILSVIVSTLFSYFSALIFGFTRETLSGCFLVFLMLFVLLLVRKKINIGLGLKKNWPILFVGILIYAVYFTALAPAIFQLHDGYFVMGGPNWQDTAMHLSIIESITQGNFPPQAPYFSGQPLTYYYFSDLHAAIVNTFFGKFFPEILTLLNPFLAMTFFFSVFALAYQLTRKKIFSVISGMAAVFYGNMGFINLIKTLVYQKINYFTLISTNPFNFDMNYLQMTPMADYFLQNRPMMVGLPALIIVILLLLNTKELDRKYITKIFVAGVIAASLIKFQLFGFIISWIFFGIYFGLKFFFKKIKFVKFVEYLFIFGLPSLLIGLIFASGNVEGRSLVKIFIDSFTWGSWQKQRPVWIIYFLIGNLEIGFLIFLFGAFLKSVWKNIEIASIYITAGILITIPIVATFTIYKFDMLKFFYYLIPLMCVILAYIFSKLKHKKAAIFIFIFVTIISSLTSINLLVHSYLNKSEGYSLPDYKVGLWIINNIPQKSVFVTTPTVHSAPTDVGGRLRIISYINWPYSHGFNIGPDNVFSRVKDVEAVYRTGDISLVKVKYGAEYVYYGQDEKGQFPGAGKLFDSNKNLKLIYNRDGIEIYAIL